MAQIIRYFWLTLLWWGWLIGNAIKLENCYNSNKKLHDFQPIENSLCEC